MTGVTHPILFVATVVAILCIPGPTNTLLWAGGATLGVRRALPFVVAEGSAYLVSILAIRFLGLATVGADPVCSLILRVFVGCYLLYLARKLWLKASAATERETPLITVGQIFRVTIVNPKALIISLGVIPYQEPLFFAYLPAFSCVCASVAIGWITLGAAAKHLAASRGFADSVPRLGAAVIGAFSVVLMGSVIVGH